MGLFSKKPTTVEELTKAIAALSEEDKKKLYAQAFGQVDEPSESEFESATAEQQSAEEKPVATEETSEDSDNGEQTDTETEAPVEEPATEQESAESDASAEEVAQQQEERHEDIVAALTARLEACEQRLARFEEVMNEIDSLHDDGPLGASAQADVGDGEDDEDDRIMSAYNPNWRRG